MLAEITTWKQDLASGHSSTWLATAITVWGIAVILFSWYLAKQNKKGTSLLLAAILLYEVLP